jgi:hypothetical protein
MRNKLALRTERLNELTTDDLHAVAGGAQRTLGVDCLSLLRDCNSIQVCTTAMSCGCSPSWNCS